MKTFLINLQKDTERLKFMDAQLQEGGLLYERFEAINSRTDDVSKEYDAGVCVARKIPILKIGEIGCAVSHKKIYERIVHDSQDYTLIFEDDVSIPCDFKMIVEKEIEKNKKKNKWEYLSFNYTQVGSFFYISWIKAVIKIYKNSNLSMQHKLLFFPVYFVKFIYFGVLSSFEFYRDVLHKKIGGSPVYFFRPLYLAGAYLITLEGAKKLLELNKPLCFPADQVPNQARIKKSLKFMAYSPLLVRQQGDKFGSSILDIKYFNK